MSNEKQIEKLQMYLNELQKNYTSHICCQTHVHDDSFYVLWDAGTKITESILKQIELVEQKIDELKNQLNVTEPFII